MNKIKLSIVIVNWNSGLFLRDCVNSILLWGSKFSFSIVIVDNNSNDRSCDFLEHLDVVKLIRSPVNLGFAKGCNLGAKELDSEFLLFLNPDAAIYQDTLDKVLVLMQSEESKTIGICGVQLVDGENTISRSCAKFPVPSRFLFQALGLDRLFPYFSHFMIDWKHDTTRDVDQVIGAFFFVKKRVFDSLYGFDERFFVYFEELDFSFRAHQAGWRTVYLADVQAFHAGGGASDQIKATRLFYLLRSRLLYAFKHFSIIGSCVVLVSTVMIEPITRVTLSLFRLSWSTVSQILAAYIMLYRWLISLIFMR